MGADSTFYNFKTGNRQLTKSGWKTELILLLTITLSHKKKDEDHVRVESVPNRTYSRGEEEEEEEEERGQYLSHYR